MAKVLFKRGTTEEIEALPTEDGAFIIDTKKGKSYTDVGNTRIPVGSAGNEVVIGNEEQITEDTKLFIDPDEVLSQGNDNSNEYSTEEQVIGKWMNKPLYRKVIDFGSLPNTTNTDVPTNIVDEINVVNIYGIAINSNGNRLPIPYTAGELYNISISYQHAEKKVRIQTYSDRSAMSAYVVIEYTKTID